MNFRCTMGKKLTNVVVDHKCSVNYTTYVRRARSIFMIFVRLMNFMRKPPR